MFNSFFLSFENRTFMTQYGVIW